MALIEKQNGEIVILPMHMIRVAAIRTGGMMTTEKMSDKDALYLYATEPEKLIHKGISSPCNGKFIPSVFLGYWRDGSIILAPILDKPPKPVRVKVRTIEKGKLTFFLPREHQRHRDFSLNITEAPSYGGVYVYHLPDERTIVTSHAPIFWLGQCWFNHQPDGQGAHILWPEEIEFDPAFLTNHKGEQ